MRLCRTTRDPSTQRTPDVQASCWWPCLCSVKPPQRLFSTSTALKCRAKFPCTNYSSRCWRPRLDTWNSCIVQSETSNGPREIKVECQLTAKEWHLGSEVILLIKIIAKIEKGKKKTSFKKGDYKFDTSGMTIMYIEVYRNQATAVLL